MYRTTKYQFRAILKGLTQEIRLNKSRGKKFNDLNIDKNISRLADCQMSKYKLAYQARHWLLAYGFLSKKPYKTIENKCDVAPSAEAIYNILVLLRSVDGYIRTTKQDVERWLGQIGTANWLGQVEIPKEKPKDATVAPITNSEPKTSRRDTNFFLWLLLGDAK